MNENKSVKLSTGNHVMSFIVVSAAIITALMAWPWVQNLAEKYVPQIVYKAEVAAPEAK